MAFNYDNKNWTPITAQKASEDLMARVNNILASNGITNFLKPLISNVVWIVLLAVGQIRSVFDQLLYQAQNSLSISNCSSDQVENLLPIIGTQKIAATYTTVWLKVIATMGGTCTVPAGSELVYNSGISFETVEELIVPVGDTGYVRAQCDTLGKIEVYDGQLTEFVANITNLDSVENGTYTVGGVLCSTVVGQSLETTSHVRARVINGNVIDNSLNGFIRALQSVQGVGSVNVVYNSSTAVELVLVVSTGTLSIPPRQMWVLTQDEDLTGVAIAEAWFANSLIETFDANRASTLEQKAETLIGQELSVFYDTMVNQDIYVQVNLPSNLSPLSAANKLIIVNIILTLNIAYTGGGQVTEIDIGNLFRDFTNFKIYGFDVSLTGSGFTEYVDIFSDAMPVFSEAKISYNYI